MTVGGGRPANRGRAGHRLASLAQGAVLVACDWLGGLTDWAGGRALAADSLAGVSLPLALCACAWFSGGTGPDVLGGVLALCGWLIARVMAVGLANPPVAQTRGSPAAPEHAADPRWDGGPDQTALPGREFAWLFAVCSAVGECFIYGGIAAGSQPGGWTGRWPLAAATIISVALADMMIACGATAAGGLAKIIAGSSVPWRWIGRILPLPAGPRVALAGLVLILRGPRVALLTLLVVEVASMGVVGWRLGRLGSGRPRARREMVVACRDDGALARWAGRLVRGNIAPMLPVCAGICAITLLAVLGLGGLPAAPALAPLMALLLAAPGSAHPHDGPADWLAPVLLALGQFIYLACLGFARQVPGPVVVTLCALTATWYASLAARSAASGLSAASGTWPGSGKPAGGLGWESRMLVVTFAAIVGFANVGYLGMSVYLGVLICRQVVAGYLTPAWATLKFIHNPGPGVG